VFQIAAGKLHCAAVTEDGALFTWDTREDADEPIPELGYGMFVPDCRAPYRVFALEGVRITSVTVGWEFTMAVTEAGAVYSFEVGDGRLGHGEGNENEGVFLPKRIEALMVYKWQPSLRDAFMLLLSPGVDGCTHGGHSMMTSLSTVVGAPASTATTESMLTIIFLK
jgi:alpha-tubulin suppressor-like RCC1 family protein